ncbi:competence protein ComEA [Trichococcus patagoniensis]|uniref:Competence protein ComEA n=1 Tax=Trichococcus patagoniensis TaxID=382641 RepID=A0A2T5IRD4_9LACT|nr:helix-hairpin-helix domain-containing protein [Trichococcus patagoniensis]PTQ86393.1 competence protein ComEA [Trichococcus patagoniensis]
MDAIREWLACHKQEVIRFAVLFLFLVVCLFGLGRLIYGNTEEIGTGELQLDETYVAASSAESNQSPEQPEESEPVREIIIVDIKGAVSNPGVYQAEAAMRVIDIIDLAGGLRETADADTVNLSQRVTDQMVIYIPAIGEEAERPIAVPENPLAEQESGNGVAGTEKVDINTADAVLLQTLNGIGEKKAVLIIAYREENGSFQTIEEIMEVSGIGEKTFEGFKNLITVGAK